MIKETIAKLVVGENLREEEMLSAMGEIMEGAATPAQIAAFMTALRIKGETVEELTGAARTMRRMATRIDARSSVVVDTCGTGGDGMNTFNISTTTAFVVAAAGLTVAKHGNRAVSSRCGSADVLEALGVNINVGPEIMEECLQQIGLAFLFAPQLHGAMKYALGPRREIGIRTIFNMLGPLTNPAGATAQLIGVYDPKLTEMFAGVLKNLGTKRAFIVHGGGLDEATVTGETRVSELNEGLISTYNIDPLDLLGEIYPDKDLAGGDAEKNAGITLDILTGRASGASRQIVVLNAALAIVAGGKANTIAGGIAAAQECINSGAALEKLHELKERSNN
ncbi:MAG: anthranilate phosphoribosyltransferase [Syntrophobacterales bacterium]|nr:anthranilate phosphoribosyltransferase [Syntrophobacterales bacterium]